jgi:hypothetical protein
VYICSSQLCDDEIRRSLILISQNKSKSSSIQNLDELHEIISFLPVTSELLKEASTLWAILLKKKLIMYRIRHDACP